MRIKTGYDGKWARYRVLQTLSWNDQQRLYAEICHDEYACRNNLEATLIFMHQLSRNSTSQLHEKVEGS